MSKLRWIDWLVVFFIGFIIIFIFVNIGSFVNKGVSLFAVDSPLVFPVLIGISMFVCWVIAIEIDIKKANIAERSEEEIGRESKELIEDIKSVLIYLFGVYVYIFALGQLRFLAASILFVTLGMVYMNYEQTNIPKRFLNAGLVACITVPVLYFVFYKVFNVMLP